ncbi:MAG TPA: ACP phosphodiesterase [Chitinophagaceae bacterium]|nr:ACP phosphodiesterase [Chitinophagaceae bacterium]
MNYLAHAYLSFDHKEILVGNLISDFIKGNKKYNYPENIQKGIALHRSIDTFTDAHEATKLARNIFRPHYRLYSGAFVDVVYDHFLAIDTKEFPGTSLQDFSAKVYEALEHYTNYFPDPFARMFPFMKLQNWLFNYSTVRGTELSFKGLVRRAAYIDESETAASLFQQHYNSLKDCYLAFFPDVKSFAHREYEAYIKL